MALAPATRQLSAAEAPRAPATAGRHITGDPAAAAAVAEVVAIDRATTAPVALMETVSPATTGQGPRVRLPTLRQGKRGLAATATAAATAEPREMAVAESGFTMPGAEEVAGSAGRRGEESFGRGPHGSASASSRPPRRG